MYTIPKIDLFDGTWKAMVLRSGDMAWRIRIYTADDRHLGDMEVTNLDKPDKHHIEHALRYKAREPSLNGIMTKIKADNPDQYEYWIAPLTPRDILSKGEW